MEADIPAQQGILHPDTLVYPVKDGIKIKEFNDSIGLSLVLIPSGKNKEGSIVTTIDPETQIFVENEIAEKNQGEWKVKLWKQI